MERVISPEQHLLRLCVNFPIESCRIALMWFVYVQPNSTIYFLQDGWKRVDFGLVLGKYLPFGNDVSSVLKSENVNE